MKNTNWEKSSGTPFEHFPVVVYPSVFDIYVGIYFFALLENALGFHESFSVNTVNPVSSP